MRFLKIEFVAIALGIMAGVGLVVLWPVFDTWDFIGRVPATPTQILDTGYVQTSDGTVYFCVWYNDIGCSPVENYKVEKPIINTHEPERDCGDPHPDTPLYPGNVLVSYQRRICGPEGYFDLYIIALDDGTIWSWRNGMRGLGAFISGIGGALLGAILGIPIYLAVWWRSRRQGKAKRGLP